MERQHSSAKWKMIHVNWNDTNPMKPDEPAQPRKPDAATHSPRKTVRIYMEGGCIQDVDVPKGVEVVTIDQDEIECGEQGTFVHDGGPDETQAHAQRLADALNDIVDSFEKHGKVDSDWTAADSARQALEEWSKAQ